MACPVRARSICPSAAWAGTTLAWFCCLGQGLLTAQDAYVKPREKMVEEQVERAGVRNETVLNALREVPRHLFVESKYRSDVYKDTIVPLGYKQTLSTAYIVGYMTEKLDPQPTDRVLEIGTGSGYQAAVLAKIVKEVYSIEIVEPLGKGAKERLAKLGFRNVETRVGDGFKGWPEKAPFDKIIVTCSPEKAPQPLLDQLAEGGKMIIPLGDRYNQAFYLYEKLDGRLNKTKLLPTLFVPMTGQAEKNREHKLDYAHPRIVNGGFESANQDIPDAWFYLRQAILEKKKAPGGKNALAFTNDKAGWDAHALQAIGVDGSKVKLVTIKIKAEGERILPGPEAYERAGVIMQFYDAQNRKVGNDLIIGPWLGTFGWMTFEKEGKVPPEAAMATIQIGLRGATGQLKVADVKLLSRAR